MMWGFPKIRGTILGVPIIRIIVYWVLYWDPPILGNYHVCCTILSDRGVPSPLMTWHRGVCNMELTPSKPYTVKAGNL